MNPLDLLRHQQAQNRANHAEAEKKRERKPQANDYNYVGGNADTGKAILQNGSGGVVSANAITNGLIKPNQPVKTSQAGSLMTVDAMPRPKTELKKLNPVSFGKIKILFSKIEGEQRVFYVGGDRLAPKRIYAIPKDAAVSTAILHNLGDGDHYTVGLFWSHSGEAQTQVIGAQAATVDYAYPFRLNYLGHGFWVDILGTRVIEDSSFVGQFTPASQLPLGESRSSTQTFTYSASPPNARGGGGGVALRSNIHSGNGDLTDTFTASKSYSYSDNDYSFYQGKTQELSGIQTSSYEIDDYYFQPNIGHYVARSTGLWLRDWSGTVPILPNVSRPYAQSIRDPLYPYGENVPIVETSSYPYPIVAGKNVSSAVYRLKTYNNPDQYRFATSSTDLVLGGELPTFRNVDNLIDQTLYSVQWNSLVLSQKTLLKIDNYALSGNTTKTTKEVSAFAIKLDSKSLEKETELPLASANFNVYNASYHP